MVTILQQPDDVALSKGGRLEYVFSGNGRFVHTGVKGTNAILFKGPVLEGDVINLFWKGRNLKMVARENPVETNEFPTGAGDKAYTQTILPYFRDFYPIEQDFDVTVPEEAVLIGLNFLAKRPGPPYNLSPYLFGNIEIPSPVLLGVNEEVRPRYSVYVELWAKRGDDTAFKRLSGTPLETDAQGRATYDPATTLHSYLTADLPLWNAHTAQASVKSRAEYYVRYAEAWGEPLAIGRLTKHTTNRVHLGGMPYEQLGRFELADFVAGSDGLQRALRIGPTTRYIRFDEPQYLTFLNLKGALTGARLEVVLKLDDNSSIALTKHELATLATHDKITFPVGPQQVGIPAVLADAPGRTLKEYTVQLKTQDGEAHSILYRYVVDYRYRSFIRHFAYINSLGSLDTLTTYGQGSPELDLFHEQAERHLLPSAYELTDGQFVEYDTAIQQRVEVTSGWRTDAELRLWKDFYRAESRWRLFSAKALPIALISKSIKEKKDDDTNFAHRFEYTYRYKDEFTYDPADEVEPPPPPGLLPAGTVVISPTSPTTNNRDDSVPEVVRTIGSQKMLDWDQAHAWGDHASQGYLTQQSGSDVFAGKTHSHSYSELADKPGLNQLENLNAPDKTPEIKTVKLASPKAAQSVVEILLRNTETGEIEKASAAQLKAALGIVGGGTGGGQEPEGILFTFTDAPFGHTFTHNLGTLSVSGKVFNEFGSEVKTAWIEPISETQAALRFYTEANGQYGTLTGSARIWETQEEIPDDPGGEEPPPPTPVNFIKAEWLATGEAGYPLNLRTFLSAQPAEGWEYKWATTSTWAAMALQSGTEWYYYIPSPSFLQPGTQPRQLDMRRGGTSEIISVIVPPGLPDDEDFWHELLRGTTTPIPETAVETTIKPAALQKVGHSRAASRDTSWWYAAQGLVKTMLVAVDNAGTPLASQPFGNGWKGGLFYDTEPEIYDSTDPWERVWRNNPTAAGVNGLTTGLKVIQKIWLAAEPNVIFVTPAYTITASTAGIVENSLVVQQPDPDPDPGPIDPNLPVEGRLQVGIEPLSRDYLNVELKSFTNGKAVLRDKTETGPRQGILYTANGQIIANLENLSWETYMPIFIQKHSLNMNYNTLADQMAYGYFHDQMSVIIY